MYLFLTAAGFAADKGISSGSHPQAVADEGLDLLEVGLECAAIHVLDNVSLTEDDRNRNPTRSALVGLEGNARCQRVRAARSFRGKRFKVGGIGQPVWL